MDSTGLDILFVTEKRYAGCRFRRCMQRKKEKSKESKSRSVSYLKHDHLVTGASRSNRILIRARNINAQ